MTKRNDVPLIIEGDKTASASQTLIRSVKEAEVQLAKENKLIRLQIGTAIVMTTCPEKYKHLKI